MLGYIEGEIIAVSQTSVLIKTGGLGYIVNMAKPSLEQCEKGARTELFITETVSPYDGTVLYGFLTDKEKELFTLFRETVPDTGSKKALDLLGKALKSPADFKQAIMTGNTKLLTGIFGFTSKTADKLINALKDKIAEINLGGDIRIHIDGGGQLNPALTQTYEALCALGYSPSQCKKAVEKISLEGGISDETAETLVKKCLRVLSV